MRVPQFEFLENGSNGNATTSKSARTVTNGTANNNMQIKNSLSPRNNIASSFIRSRIKENDVRRIQAEMQRNKIEMVNTQKAFLNKAIPIAGIIIAIIFVFRLFSKWA